MSRTEGIDCFLHRLPYLVLFEQFGRNRPPVGKVSRPKISVFVLLLFVDRLVEVRARLLQPPFCFVVRNLNKPGAELCFRTEATEVRKGLKNGLLRYFFGVSG